MNPRKIWTIYRKDLRDAIMDSRVLIAVVIPIALGLFYNFIFDEDIETTPTATVAYTAVDDSVLIQNLEQSTAGLNLTFTELSSEQEVRQQLTDSDADIGLIIPAGFDAAVQQGQTPDLQVILTESPGVSGQYILASLDDTLRQMAGQQPPAAVQVEQVPTEEESTFIALEIYEELGLGSYFVLVTAIMLIAMISMLAVPVILAEEAEKRTLDALVLIASYGDVIVAKALVGLTYIVVSVGLLLGLTQLTPENMPLFILSIVLTSVSLIGFGLLIGGVFRNANQLNTWSGFFLIPVIAPAFMVGLPLPDIVQTILDFIPTSQATKLLVNGVSGLEIFPNVWLGIVVLLVWIVIAYGLLARSLSRREA